MKKIFTLFTGLFCCVAIFAQNEKKEGDEMAATENYSGAAMMYRLCMQQDEDCLLKLIRLLYEEKVEPQFTNELYQLISPLAVKGNAEAQFYLGVMYFKGFDTKDNNKSFEWIKKSAEQGHADAQYQLGYMYQKGFGVNQDVDEALRWYRKSMSQGHEEAKFRHDELVNIPAVTSEQPANNDTAATGTNRQRTQNEDQNQQIAQNQKKNIQTAQSQDNDRTIQAIDYEAFKKLRRNDRDMENFLKQNDAALYKQFHKGTKLRRTGKALFGPGLGLTIAGLVMGVGGAILSENSETYEDEELGIDISSAGAVGFVIGQALIITSIPLSATGGSLKRRAANGYANKHFGNRSDYSPSLDFNFTGNGLGFALRF